VKLVYVEEQPDRTVAMRREIEIKKLTHKQKAQLVNLSKRQAEMTDQSIQKIKVLSPGRVNMLGEHVDYNDGLVLPAAIDKEVVIEALPLVEELIRIKASDLNETVEMTLESIPRKQDVNGKPLPGWALYPAGVAHVLRKYLLDVNGVEAEFSSNLPIGAGLSSSAAVEVGFAVLWEKLGGWNIDRMTLAQFCQEAEVTYVGVNCGLMDQFACANGVKGHALLLDTRSLDWRPVKLPAGTCIVVADSGVRHSLVTSEYNTRHDECNEAVRILKKHRSSIKALRDASLDDLDAMKGKMSEAVYRRAKHVITEVARVFRAVELLDKGDGVGFGQLMVETHASLRDDYAVSCKETDLLVELAMQIPGCLGARITGGGFGGCTVNLVKEEAVEAFISRLHSEYLEASGKDTLIFHTQAEDGARIVA
jgi:galactokinase